MQRKIIRFKTPEEIAEFIKICSGHDSDINIYKGSTVIDAKSIVGVFSIGVGEKLEVEIISKDTENMDKFYDEISMFYEVKTC